MRLKDSFVYVVFASLKGGKIYYVLQENDAMLSVDNRNNLGFTSEILESDNILLCIQGCIFTANPVQQLLNNKPAGILFVL